MNKPINKRLLLASLCVLAGLQASAHAAVSSASTEVKNLTYELIDLDLTDGIAPTLTFSTYNPGIYTALEGFGEDAYQGKREHGSVTLTRPYAAVGASSSEFALRTSASAKEASNRGVATAISSLRREFVLSANTAVRWSATGTISVEQPAGGTGTRGAVALSTSWSDQTAQGGGYGWDNDSYATEQGSGIFDLSVYVENRGTSRTGEFELWSGSTAKLAFVAAPVPEPATYGMLLAGAAIVGMRARRRRS